MDNGWHRKVHRHRVSVARANNEAVRDMRPTLKGTIVIVDEGGPSLYVDCDEADDAMLIKLAHHLNLFAN